MGVDLGHNVRAGKPLGFMTILDMKFYWTIVDSWEKEMIQLHGNSISSRKTKSHGTAMTLPGAKRVHLYVDETIKPLPPEGS